MSSTATLRFSGALDDSNVKLFELEPGMEDTLSRGDRFFIKGSTSKKAAGLVLCSETKTFSMRKAETSNVVLVVNGVDEPAAKKRKMAGSDAEAQTGGGRVATVSASVGEFYQLTETAPKLERLREMLQECPFDGTRSSVEGQGEDQGESGRLYSFEALRSEVQASDAELRAGLRAARAVEVDGHWRVLAPDFLERVFGAILDVIVEKDWPLDKLPARALEAELGDEDPRAVRHSVALHSSNAAGSSPGAPADTAATSTPGAQDETWALDRELVCRFVAARVLRRRDANHHGPWPANEFREEWEMALPCGLEPDSALLRGLAVEDVDAAAGGAVLRALSAATLSDDAAARFAELFAFKERWSLAQRVLTRHGLGSRQD